MVSDERAADLLQCADGVEIMECSIESEYGDLPDPRDVDLKKLNRVAYVLKQLHADMDILEAQADAEREALQNKLDARVKPIQSKIDFLERRYHTSFSDALQIAENCGKKSVKLLNATIKRKTITYKGQLMEEAAATAVKIARKAGLESIITPKRIIPESVGWGELKKQISFETEKTEDGALSTKAAFKEVSAAKAVPLSILEGEDGIKLLAVDTDTGETAELAVIERSGGDIDIKLES